MDADSIRKLESFFGKFKRLEYKKGEIIIRADDEPQGVYYLTKGLVTEYLISRKGNEVLLEAYIPTMIFPMSWAVNGKENIYYYEALEDSEVLRAPREQFISSLRNDPDIVFAGLQRAYDRVDDLRIRMAYGLSGDAYARVVQELLLVAWGIGLKDPASGAVRIPNFVEKYSAARTGLTQETVSREMKKLKAKHLLTFQHNGLVIRDLRLLENELNIY